MELTDADRSRMQYYLKEMREKFVKHPESLTLRNGINAIEQRLGLPITVEAIDPMQELEILNKYGNNY